MNPLIKAADEFVFQYVFTKEKIKATHELSLHNLLERNSQYTRARSPVRERSRQRMRYQYWTPLNTSRAKIIGCNKAGRLYTVAKMWTRKSSSQDLI